MTTSKQTIRFTSRKFIVTIVSLALMIAIPLVYHRLGISDVVIMCVLGGIAGSAGIYTGFNVLDSRSLDSKGPNGTSDNVSQ